MMSSTQSVPDERPVVGAIQSYVPDYRVGLFDEMSSQLAAEGYRFEVWHGRPSRKTAKKNNSRTGPWSVLVPQLRLTAMGRSLSVRVVGRRARSATAVIVPFSGGCVEAYRLVLQRGTKVYLWGHGKSYVSRERRSARMTKQFLARRASGIFVYTPSAVDYVVSLGVPRSKIKVVFNSTDTATLRSLRSRTTDSEILGAKDNLSIGEGPVGLFVGAFDPSKRLEFLFESIDRIHDQIPTFVALIAGSGVRQDYVSDEAEKRPYVRLLPRLGPSELATVATVADVMLMPGRVGLVAVDAAALGLPVMTTTWHSHAPEAEYLSDQNSLWSDDSVAAYSAMVSALLLDRARLSELHESSWASGADYSVEHSARQFTSFLVQ